MNRQQGNDGEIRKFGPDPRGSVSIWRRKGKGIFIGRRVRVTVLDCTRSTVRLGIEAPLYVVISGPAVSLEEHLTIQLDRDSRTVRISNTGDVTDDLATSMDLTTVVLMLQESVKVGREATITYAGEEETARASLSIEAPLNVAITRDDFTFEEHLRAQAARESGARR